MVLGDFKTPTILNLCPDADHILLRKIKELAGGEENLVIIEFGFGDAKTLFYILSQLKDKRVDYYAVETDREAISQAKPLEKRFSGKRKLRIIEGDLRNAEKISELRDVKADVIILPEVLCRIESSDWIWIFEKTKNFLQWNGWIIVIDGDKDRTTYRRPEEQGAVLEPIGIGKLRAALENTGLKTLGQQYFLDLFKERQYARPWQEIFKRGEYALHFRAPPPLEGLELIESLKDPEYPGSLYRKIYENLQQKKDFTRAVTELLSKMPRKWVHSDFIINKNNGYLFRHYFMLVAYRA